ncbi:bifunctional folylpolyglutamate synthase/dihydrofolate synthase [Naumannella cuiyingiana]|uniref:Dihydrofolate synthase/folylpolyglutamate synthase n=1 Tax=Naumannella cuiyingiana TaxID=1347891 RepID=A0A7Z0IK25_9ACTN|nr:folylpolyglutamate synthase/dihydrofolate synthase family protein [Naumannella cuiyingiana]NYI70071.1 dihydrofolate synthase/folylpolyglutamate synthase [Naumannella cuiyingiana]
MSHAELTAALTARWPEHRVAPSLSRIRALCELLGDPQNAAPVITITGTNGKGSTAIMIDALLRSTGLRTGRFSSPHLRDVTERISIDGRPISEERFAEIWADIEPYVAMVDEQRLDGVPQMTFFEVITAMAFAAFADAPVDVVILEVGLGGTWDATSVADAQVAVVTPIDVDHAHLLGDTPAKIAQEKAGIIKPGSTAVLAGQSVDVAKVLLERCAEVGAPALREGVDFGVLERQPAVGGQLLRLNEPQGTVGDVFLPLFGAHQAANAALALAAVEVFLGGKDLDAQVITDGFGDVRAPGRLELARSAPAVVLDAAHNPHGAAALVEGMREAYHFDPLIGVLAVMRDKDAEAMLRILEPILNEVVVSQVASTDRGLPAAELGELAEGIFGANRVSVQPRLDRAIEQAVALAESGTGGDELTGSGVLVTGSVIAVGEARTLLVAEEADEPVVDDSDDDEIEIVDAELVDDED